MEKGWGLDLENSDRVGFFGGKSCSSRISPMFPVDSSGRGEVLGAVDFFSEKKEIRDLDVNVSLILVYYAMYEIPFFLILIFFIFGIDWFDS